MRTRCRTTYNMCLGDLPTVLLLRIGLHLTPGEALKVARVCKKDERLLAIVDSVIKARIGLG